MSSSTSIPFPLWALSALLALTLAALPGCAGKPGTARQATPAVGSNCFAKAVPSVGEGGLAWGNSLGVARHKSMLNCVRYAGRSGGTPDTCQVVLAKCKD